MYAANADRGSIRASLVAGMVICMTLAAGPADAKKLVGTKNADQMSGTTRSDVLRGKAGNDRINGRKGDDELAGSAGKDKLVGGFGKDSLAGGGGADTLEARDGVADQRVNGGKGRDLCVIDQSDALVVKGCERVTSDAASLVVSSATGTECGSSLPLCVFQIEGTGAEGAVGLVIGGGGVTIGAGAAVALQGPGWTATGVYGCESDGFLRVTIGEKSVDVPVDCTFG
jgi:Ca2+-binding RTX toxin-like protein